MTPEQEREFRVLLAEVDEENSGWRSVMDPVAAELRDVRAALAASQTRESTLRETLTVASGYIRPRLRYVADRGFEAHSLSIAALLEEPSPLADALGRVVRAGVAYRALLLPNASEVDAEMIRRHHAFKAAVDNLLVVAPWWGELRGGG